MRLLLRALLLAAALGRAVPASALDYPEITGLSSSDLIYRQLQADLQEYYRAASRAPASKEVEYPPLRLFRCRRPAGMDLFGLAARLNLPYDTLASLNGLENPGEAARREILIVANQPGIFVAEKPRGSFEEILASVRAASREPSEEVTVLFGQERRLFRYFRGSSFHPVERAFFLGILFRFPLPIGRLTSRYGMREDPFSGSPEFHQGVDLAAPEGTEVYAARDGVVSATGQDSLLGSYVILDHEGGYQTVYGHLSSVLAVLHQRLRSGMILGRVGSTGRSTGPHLHFEVRRQGETRDPARLLPLPGGNSP